MNYYAVAVGRKPGIYNDWPACAKQILNYRGASFKKFRSIEDAEQYLSNHTNLKEVPRYLSKHTAQPRISKNLALLKYEEPSDASENVPSINKVYNPDFVCNNFVYVDAVCSSNEDNMTGVAGIGIYFDENDCRNRSMTVNDVFTDDEALLTAFVHLHHILKTELEHDIKTVIVCQSQHVVLCLTSLGLKCAREHWRKPMKHKRLIKKTFHLYQSHDYVRFMCISHDERAPDVKWHKAQQFAHLAVGQIKM